MASFPVAAGHKDHIAPIPQLEEASFLDLGIADVPNFVDAGFHPASFSSVAGLEVVG
jgi:hypothetical protein